MSIYSIVIVDDDVEFGRFVKRVLSGMGHIVEQIFNPRDFMHRYEELAPDIIFLDIFMPELDGIDVAHWLIEKRFNGKLVFMTGHDPTYLAAARAAARRGEAHVATLEKPARVDRIREILKEQRVEKTMESQNYAAGEPIFAKGEDARHLFFVLSGEVEVRQQDFVAVINRGQLFGESALLSRTRTLAARARSDCMLLSIARDEIIESFAKDPDLAIQIIDALFTKLANTTDELIRLRADKDEKAVAN